MWFCLMILFNTMPRCCFLFFFNDNLFLLLVIVIKIVIDSCCCATFVEYQKRGKDFWSEFELYLADLLVGVVVDVALVGMLAPYPCIWQSTVSSGLFGRIQHACASLPNRLVIQAFSYSSDLLF